MSKKLDKILLVEDEPDIQLVAQIALTDVGKFTLKSCSSGLEALQVAADFEPDLILLDVMMPGMDGPTTFKELRKIDKVVETPIIFMTAKIQAQERQQYLDLGAFEVIAKPFDPMTLADIIRTKWLAVYG